MIKFFVISKVFPPLKFFAATQKLNSGEFASLFFKVFAYHNYAADNTRKHTDSKENADYKQCNILKRNYIYNSKRIANNLHSNTIAEIKNCR